MNRFAHLSRTGWLLCLAAIAPMPASAADLEPAAAAAYQKHADETTRTFLARAQKLATARRCDGVMTARAGSGDGILTVPDGLVHHWLGTAYMRGVSLKQAVDASLSYSNYPKMYKAVLSSRIVSQKGDQYQVLVRIKEGESGITAVLDVKSTVDYRFLGDGSVSAISKSDEIREVKDHGEPEESLLPVGRDSGYLWRAHTFSYLVADKEGVFVVMETLGLSRRFPFGLGWIIEPIARRLGRKSVEGSLEEFLSAVRRSAGLSAVSKCE